MSSRSTAPSRKRLDRPPLGRRQRLDGGEPVDEQPVALVGGDPPGAGVRLGDVALVLERGHVVADRRRRDAQVVPLDQRLGARPAPGWTRSPRRWRAAPRACGPRARAPPGWSGDRRLWHSRQQSASVRRTAGLTGFPACPAAATGRPADRVVAVDRYSGDVLAPGWGRRRPRTPRVAAERDLVVEDVETGFCGAVVRTREDDRRAHRDAGGPARPAPGVPAGARVPGRRLPGRAGPAGPAGGARRCPAYGIGLGGRPRSARPGSPAAAGSTSRASTTPSWSRRSGATTCASRASWSSTSAASTTCPPSSATSAPPRDRRLGVLVDHLVAGQQGVAARRARSSRRTCWSSVTRTSTSGRRSGRARWASPPGRRCPAGTPWKEGVCAGLGWPVDPPAAWRRILGAVRSYADLEPSLLGRVEELIDFVTHGDAGP